MAVSASDGDAVNRWLLKMLHTDVLDINMRSTMCMVFSYLLHRAPRCVL